jgi:hypothetical protein
MHTTNQKQGCYDQGHNKEGALIDRIMLVTQAVNALGYFIIAPFLKGVVLEVQELLYLQIVIKVVGQPLLHRSHFNEKSFMYSQFPHSCICERFIYSQEWSTYFPAAE